MAVGYQIKICFVLAPVTFQGWISASYFLRSSFSEFAARHGKDEKFKGVEKMREREQMFTDYLGELKKAGNKVKEEQKAVTKTKTEKVPLGGCHREQGWQQVRPPAKKTVA